jgi:hypothetical protein
VKLSPHRPSREQSAVLAAFSVVMAVLSWPTLQGRSSSVVPSFQTATLPWAADPRGLAFAWPQSDQAESVFPWSALLQRTWQSRELPLWDPHSFGGGVPWATDGVAAPLYPLRAILDGLLPLWLAHDVFVLVHLALAGAGTYWLARRWGAGRLGATVAGTGWMANAYVWSWAPLEMVTPFFAYLPLALAAADSAVRHPSRRRVVLAAVILGLTLVFGNITYSLIAATTTGLYLAALSMASGVRADRGQRLRAFGTAALPAAAVLVLGLALAAFALLPTLLNLLSTSRQPFTFDTLRADLLVPFEVYGRVLRVPESPPTAEQIIHMVYLTPAVVLLGLVGLVAARGGGAWSARAVLAVTVLVASTVPGAWVAYHLLPGFDVIKPYARLLPVALLAVHVLSGLGADALLGWTKRWSPSRGWIAGTVAVVVVAGVFLPAWAVATRVDPPYLSVEQHPPYPPTPLTRSVRGAGRATPWPDRIVPGTLSYDTEPPTGGSPTFVGGTASAPGFDTWGGYASAVPERSSQLVRLVSGEQPDVVFAAGTAPDLTYPRYPTGLTDWALACRMGSDLVTVSPPPPEGVVEDWGSLDPTVLDERYSGPDGRLLALPPGCAAGPYLSPETMVAGSDLDAVQMLRRQGTEALRAGRDDEVSRQVVLSQRPESPSTTSSGATGRVASMLRDGSDVVARVEASDDMWLVLPVAYDDGWSVTVDDQPVATARVDFNRLGVRVEAGASTAVATYRPPGWHLGLLGTALGVVGCVLLLAPRPRRRS